MLTEKLKNVHRLQGKLMSEHYQRALAAKSEGRPVAYVTAMFPVEIVKAFEPHLATVYPENHAALAGTGEKRGGSWRRRAPPLQPI